MMIYLIQSYLRRATTTVLYRRRAPVVTHDLFFRVEKEQNTMYTGIDTVVQQRNNKIHCGQLLTLKMRPNRLGRRHRRAYTSDCRQIYFGYVYALVCVTLLITSWIIMLPVQIQFWPTLRGDLTIPIAEFFSSSPLPHVRPTDRPLLSCTKTSHSTRYYCRIGTPASININVFNTRRRYEKKERITVGKKCKRVLKTNEHNNTHHSARPARKSENTVDEYSVRALLSLILVWSSSTLGSLTPSRSNNGTYKNRTNRVYNCIRSRDGVLQTRLYRGV